MIKPCHGSGCERSYASQAQCTVYVCFAKMISKSQAKNSLSAQRVRTWNQFCTGKKENGSVRPDAKACVWKPAAITWYRTRWSPLSLSCLECGFVLRVKLLRSHRNPWNQSILLFLVNHIFSTAFGDPKTSALWTPPKRSERNGLFKKGIHRVWYQLIVVFILIQMSQVAVSFSFTLWWTNQPEILPRKTTINQSNTQRIHQVGSTVHE